MNSPLFWIYLINAILLIVHEMDSTYHKEWELFKIPGGIKIFLLLHIPIFFIVLWGLVEVYDKTLLGLIFSLVLGLSGIFAFFIHTYFIKKGDEKFNNSISLIFLRAILGISILQIGFIVYNFV